MQEVSFGQFSMNLQIELEKKCPKVTEQDVDRVIDYYGRKYKIISFDIDRRSVQFLNNWIVLDLETVRFLPLSFIS